MRKNYWVVLVISLSVMVCLFVTNSFLTQNGASQSNLPFSQDEQSKQTAALVDSLYVCVPDDSFTSGLVETLTQAGFSVDVYAGENVTVDLLYSFEGCYDLIVFRMHSAVHSKTLGLYLFTAEPYSENKYLDEQRFGMVKKAYAFDYSEPVFAVNWMFVKKCMTQKFCNTTVIVMGCDGTCDLKLSTAFFNQGAKAYIGWNGLILPSHSSKATLQLVENLYTNNLSFQEALQKTNNQIGADPTYGSTLILMTP